MKKEVIYLVFGVLLVLIGISYTNFNYFSSSNQIKEICFEDRCFSCEVADNNLERARGLMFREFLNDNECMLFIFDSSDIHSFWMKNTLIDLDIVWLGSNKSVVYFDRGFAGSEESIIPDKESLYILEFNSGIIEELGVGVGSVFDWEG